jgi:hypothetical protein
MAFPSEQEHKLRERRRRGEPSSPAAVERDPPGTALLGGQARPTS